MSESLMCSDEPLRTADRRLGPRHQVSSIMYVKLGENNGGVILNVSECGVAVQTAMVLVGTDLPLVRFQLSASKWIQASAHIAWLSKNKRTVGLQFIQLPEKARAEIREWLAAEKGDVLPPKPVADERSLSRIAATSQDASEHAVNDSGLEKRQNLIPRHELSAPLPSSTDTMSSLVGLSSSPQHDGLPEKRILYDSAPLEAEHSIASSAHARPARLIASRLRRYLVDERHRIRLHDLVSRETEHLCIQLRESNFPANTPVTAEEFLMRINRYEELSEVVLSIIPVGCFWGDRKLDPIWAKLVERVATADARNTGKPQWVSLRFYPALLLLYTGGLAAVARSSYSTLAALLLLPKLKVEDGIYPLIERLYASSVIEDEKFVIALCGATRYKVPASAYLYAFLRERLREFIPSDTEYSEVFNRFEYLLALVWMDQNPKGTRVDWVPVDGPLGLFASRTPGRGEIGIIEQVEYELTELGKSCPLLRAGLFGGSLGRLRSAIERIAARIQSNQNDLGLMRHMVKLRFSAR